ncbi:hypothetical protein AURDEDRAFT_112313 [Auricularia subglabra TFB-10046 SS5]|nr:hypothetical protein AURDEDRAFT_112313 [Auricularia subglabra TFB-10046 SS5]
MHAEFWDASPTSYGCLDCSIVLENMKPKFLDEWQVTDVSVRFLTVSCPVTRSYGPSQRERGPEQYEDFTSLIGERRSDPVPTTILLQITIPPRASDNHVCTAAIRFPVSILERASDRTFMICGSVMCKAKEVRAKDRDWIKEGGRWMRLYRKDEVRPGTTVTLQCESVLFTISSLRRGVHMDP